MINWKELEKKYSPDQIVELQKLYALKGGNQAQINAQRQIVRNMGLLSLPFSMNKKKG